jgi:hypothetical protein
MRIVGPELTDISESLAFCEHLRDMLGDRGQPPDRPGTTIQWIGLRQGRLVRKNQGLTSRDGAVSSRWPGSAVPRQSLGARAARDEQLRPATAPVGIPAPYDTFGFASLAIGTIEHTESRPKPNVRRG